MGSFTHPVDGTAIHSKKDAKMIRRKLARGGTVLSSAEYKLAQQQKAEKTQQKVPVTQQQQGLPSMPADLEREKLEEYAPGICRDVREREPIRTSQADAPYRARAIWFNDFDDTHTFNKKYRQPRLLYSILLHYRIKGEPLHVLVLLFIAGCLERDVADEGSLQRDQMFKRREAFVKAWLRSTHDLYIFTMQDWDRFGRMRRDLAARLMGIGDRADTNKFKEARVLALVDEFLTALYQGSDAEARWSTWQEMVAAYDEVKDDTLADSGNCEKASALLDRLRADIDGANVHVLVEKALEAAEGGAIAAKSMYVTPR